MNRHTLLPAAALLTLAVCAVVPISAQRVISLSASQASSAPVVPSRVVDRVDDTQLVRLPGNTHPMARPEYERGLVEPTKLLEHIVLVLKRSPEQEKALAAFNERQYDPKSPDYHHWLHPEEFGRLYGPSDADIAAVKSWLESHGMHVEEVNKGKVTLFFSATVAQVQEAFHVEMHKYTVNNEQHIANDRDPQIPQALAPVVTGIASLHDFFPKHQSFRGDYVRRDMKTGKYTRLGPNPDSPEKDRTGGLQTATNGKEGTVGTGQTGTGTLHGIIPQFGYVDPSTDYIREELSPYDVATIYNILPLWNASTPINGNGVTVAVVATSDVEASDFNTFRKSFGLPATTLQVAHGNGGDPGITDGQGENTEDVEMAGSTAPGATILLVSTQNASTTAGVFLSVNDIADNELAPIMTGSYGECELGLGQAGNAAWNSTWQEGATAGISVMESAGDQGAAGCNNQNASAPDADTIGLQVNGIASSPYVTAVGGTDLAWPFSTNPYTDYWNTSNDANGASAKGYMPETTWNTTCTNPLLLEVYTDGSGNPFSSNEALCNATAGGSVGDLTIISGGSGGVSHCTDPSGSTASSCTGGYPKPSWQTGSGVPADGHRDVPDVSFFASYGFRDNTGLPGSALLICQASNSPTESCNYSEDYIMYQENGGTSAAAPLTAGIMALVVQKTGSKQGLANPMFYSLAAKQKYSNCNSNTITAGTTCIFNDTTSGTNAQVCQAGSPDCNTATSGDTYGVQTGYSAVTGYDTSTGLGSMNVANLVNAWSGSTATPTATLTPSSVTFPSTTVNKTSTTTETVTLKNTSTTALTISNIEITGTDYTSYNATTTCASPLAGGSSCTVTITFTPLATGTLTASLVISDNTSSGSQTTTISGTGVNATAPAVSLSPTSLTFASTAEGKTSAAQTVTVKNTGTGALTISSETITGTNTKSFVVSSKTCGSSLAAGASCTVSVEFTPALTGALTANLSVADNASGSPQTVKLSGTGTAASAPGISLSATSLSFPATITNTTSDAQVVTVTNTGTSAVTISSIALSGTNASSFEQFGTCGSSLAASAKCSIYVGFKPATTGSLTATLSVTDNASGSPQKVTLSGTGTGAPSVKLSVTSLTFSATHATTSAAQTVTLTNSGTATLDLTSIAVTGTNATSFEALNTCAATLAAGANCAVYVAFKPATTGSFSAKLTVTDNGSASPQSVTLTGTGK
jgi:hypothetical protein